MNLKTVIAFALLLATAVQGFVVKIDDVCEHKAEVYNAGDSFKDDCNTCRCLKTGDVSCTKRLCPEQ